MTMRLLLSLLSILAAFGLHAQQLDSPPLLWGGLNQTSSIGFDYSGSPISKNRSFFNSLGKPTQSRDWDVLTDEVWASQVFYDRHGRPALQTLSAPMGSTFQFLDIFATDAAGTPYDLTNFDLSGNTDNPDPINPSSFLGHHYSTGNSLSPYQDITSYPFSRTVFSKLNPGKPHQVLGGNKINGEWKQSYSFSMPAGGALSSAGAFGPGFDPDTKVVKTVMRDVHGVDVVVFTDTDGQVLAAARSGGTCAQTLTGGGSVACVDVSFEIGRQGYVDIHLPVGVNSFSINNPAYAASGDLYVYDLITEQQIGTISSTNTSFGPGSGFYRIAVENTYQYDDYLDVPPFHNDPPEVVVSHKVNYYDYSLNKYDQAGRLIETKQPLGQYMIPTTGYNYLTSTFEYNTLGQLMRANSPDEGYADFLYRKDGQIRFSFREGTYEQYVSYTNYDQYGRPIESGIFRYYQAGHNDTYLESIVDMPDNLNDTYCEEVLKTMYDVPDPLLRNKLAQCNLDPNKLYLQTFVAGNVSKTWTEKPNTTTTWYSYDVLGRVKWIVQEIPGLGCLKTIDYTYDPTTGQVTSIDYQRHDPHERFVHHYEYNAAGQLVQVYTTLDGNLDGSTMQVQATYEYNESGQLVRRVLGDDLQGIDYVYNLNGQLKLINHPSLNPANDPGGDGPNGIPEDVFGMALDYYNGDYARPNTPTPVAQQNISTNDQYNGNIKSMRFRTQGLASGGQFNTYTYSYNKNNWLRSAGFGSGSISPIAGNKYQVNFTPDPQGDYMVNGITYDPNGNILTLKRNGYTTSGVTDANAMDEFTYHYYANSRANRLSHVTDANDNPDPNRYDDLRDQPVGNYDYNERGQLVENLQEKLEYEYYATGLVREIKKKGVPLVKFFYNDRGQRVRKETFQGGGLVLSTFYARDAAGSVLAVYHKDKYGLIRLDEHPVYGSSRLGVYYRGSAKYAYELTDHLGNVRAVVVDAGGTAVSITSKTDYYPFGMPMPRRNVDGGYRYAFQGLFSEQEKEINLNSFERRFYDPRIGRWISSDEIKKERESPYIGMGNNPIKYVDPDGRDIIILLDSDAVGGAGHTAVLIGNDEDGWTYISMNGTEGNKGKPYGNNYEPDLGFKELPLEECTSVSEVIKYVNNNTNASHNYDTYLRIETTTEQDDDAIIHARMAANRPKYVVYGQSCIDVPKYALRGAFMEDGLDFKGGYVPKLWFFSLRDMFKNLSSWRVGQGRSAVDVGPYRSPRYF
jgi:RHS repeat-associated protein